MIDEGTIRKWRDMYLCNGDKGIKPINNKYSGKFKADVLDYYYSHNMLLRETAAHFNIPSTSTISKWISIYEEALKELEYLRMENEVLKKYHALLRQKGLLKESK